MYLNKPIDLDAVEKRLRSKFYPDSDTDSGYSVSKDIEVTPYNAKTNFEIQPEGAPLNRIDEEYPSLPYKKRF
jgi:hypothetical protein